MTAEDPFLTCTFTPAHGLVPHTSVRLYGAVDANMKAQPSQVRTIGLDRVAAISRKLTTCFYLAGLPPNLVYLSIGGYGRYIIDCGVVEYTEVYNLSVFLGMQSRHYLADDVLWNTMKLVCFDTYVLLNVFEEALDLIYPLVLQQAVEEEL